MAVTGKKGPEEAMRIRYATRIPSGMNVSVERNGPNTERLRPVQQAAEAIVDVLIRNEYYEILLHGANKLNPVRR
jgi:hypothetical protein